MANYAKFTRGDLGLFAHCERKKDEFGNYITFGNERIDSSRTHLNYNLCPDSREQKEILDARISDPNVKCMNRENVVVYGSWCVTLPTQAPDIDDDGNMIYEEKEVHHRDGTVTVANVPRLHDIYYDDEQTKEFFRLCYEFLKDRYGEQNVISAYVHMDEMTPHMHFLFMPIITDSRWNEKHPDKPPREKVCAKELMNTTEMNMFHRVLQEYLDDHSEKDLYPMLNGTTIGGARTIAELKAESALEDAIMAAGQANTTRQLAEEELTKIDAKVDSVKDSAREYIETLHKREDDALNAVKKEFDDWAKQEEQKERPHVTEIKKSLENLGATPDMEKPLTEFAKSLENPITGKNGKTYIEVPSPGKIIPMLKKVVRRMLDAFGWSHDKAEEIHKQAEHGRVSLKARLPQKKIESDALYEARRSAEIQQHQGQSVQSQRKRSETSL